MRWHFVQNELNGFCMPDVCLDETACVICFVQDRVASLFPEEAKEISSMAQARQAAFSSGRYCAHTAQREIGRTPAPVVRQGRVPIWAENLRGSITHSQDIVAAVVSSTVRGVGVDVERLNRVEERLYSRLFTPTEIEAIDGNREAATLMFSAKEAGYKAIYPLGQAYIGFQEAQIELDVDRQRFRIEYLGEHVPNRLLNRGFGAWQVHLNHVFTVFFIK